MIGNSLKEKKPIICKRLITQSKLYMNAPKFSEHSGPS